MTFRSVISTMKKGELLATTVVVTVLIYASGCTRKADIPDEMPVDSVYVPSVDETEVADSDIVDTISALIAERPMPKAADELFDDFLFNFVANEKLQFSRTDFPLPVHDANMTLEVAREDWTMERFFMRQGFYTMIIDSRKQLEYAKDTSVVHVSVEKMDLRQGTEKLFNFDKVDGQWRLTSIEHSKIADNDNASFLVFYEQFVTDSAVMASSLQNPIKITGPDPEDETSNVTVELEPSEWQELEMDDLPHGTIYNIRYGQEYKNAEKKTLMMRGISNGLEAELTFECKEGQWKLVEIVF